MGKRQTEFLTGEETQVVLRVPDRRTFQGKRDYAILLTFLTTDLRKAETRNLPVGDELLQNGTSGVSALIEKDYLHHCAKLVHLASFRKISS